MAGAAPAELEVWPENWEAWQLWLRLANRWRYLAGMGGAACLGLDVPQVRETMDLLGFRKKERRRIFEQLLVMEEAALPVLNAE